MSDERKIENEIVNYSVSQKKQPYAIEMRRKRHHMVTKSRLRATNGDGRKGKLISIIVSSVVPVISTLNIIKKN